jgi:two-component system, cell cycle sensor histidine kinase PleC
MARFNASNALLRNGTIGGLARAVAQPDYLKRVAAEPMIRRIVPFMMIVFLAAAWTGAIVQLANDRSEVIVATMVDIENISALSAIDLQIELARAPSERSDSLQNLLAAVGLNALENSRQFAMTDPAGSIIASTHPAYLNRNITSILGVQDKLISQADRAGVKRLTLPDGQDALASVRNLGTDKGQLIVIQPVVEALAPWRSRAISMAFLALASSIIIIALGVAFYQQSARASEADIICEEVRRRIDVVLSSGGSGLWDWNLPRGRIFWSDSLYALLGRKRQHDFLSFSDIQQWLHPEDDNPFVAANAALNATHIQVDHEFRVRHADGHWVWIRARGQLISEPDAPHLVGIAVDITEEKAENLRRSEDDLRLRDAIETISEAFALFDPTRKLVMANTRFQNLYNLSSEMMLKGTKQSDIMNQTCPAPAEPKQILFQCSNTQDRSFECQTENGHWFQVNERTTKDGGHVSVSSDITTHKVFEASLSASNFALEQMVNDLKLSEDMLQKQRDVLEVLSASHLEQRAYAEGANRAKAEFLANMSHELRTPLNHIIGFAEMMESQVFGSLGNERYNDYVRNIGESGHYLLAVISDILDMSSLEAGRVKLDRVQVSLSDIIDGAHSDVAVAAQNKQISLNMTKTGPLYVIGDSKALYQIINNLLGNAIKFTAIGGKAGLRAKRIGEAIHLFFEDNGSGISGEMIDKIGRPFEQSGALIENGFKGSGLGLSIAKSLTELHGGSLRIRSKPGVGTIVMIKIPVQGGITLMNDRKAA